MREYMIVRYHKWREFVLEMLGGKCVDCGSAEKLEIDHVLPSEKWKNLGKIWSCKKEVWLQELNKCVLRCTYCHKVKTLSEITLEHGEGLTGKRNCYCSLCKPLKKKYNREWKQKGTVS